VDARGEAAVVLAETRKTEARDLLLEALKTEKDDEVRSWVFSALRRSFGRDEKVKKALRKH